MRTWLSLLLGTLFLLSFTLDLPKKYPTNYFRSPVNTPIRLSGTFGELRPNHLHAGIDIKGAIGQSLLAAAEGYVARIKVQEGGYGKVLYVNHPNGYTTVYAHMNKFRADIEDYVKSQQYKKEKFDIELFPPQGQFSFEKGEKIGEMGVTGRSFGPHLHFEIRDSKSEKPINPLLFGIDVKDNRRPRMHQLKVYTLNKKLETTTTKSFSLVQKGGGYGIKGDTLYIEGWRVGFGLKVYDHMNGVSNWNGIYALHTSVNDAPVYNFEMETFSFGETRYLNAHLDYEEQVSKKSYINRCYSLPGNRLSIYNDKVNSGVVNLSQHKAQKVTMVAKDVEGNQTKLNFWIKRKATGSSTKRAVYNYILSYKEENVINNNAVKLRFPKGTFYENIYMRYQSEKSGRKNTFSSMHQIHDYKTPVHKYFDLSIRPNTIPENLRKKAFIAYYNKKNEVTSYGGKWENGFLKAKVRNLGNYCIMVDNTPPTIQPISFRSDMRGRSKMTFKIKDNFDTSGRARGLRYRATVDGKWILMEYDAKNDLLIHRFDGHITSGQHELKIVLTDDRGNRTIYERGFRR